MELLNIIIPIVTMVLGLLYPEFSRHLLEKREDKKKLKKLLFHLLEIHSLIKRVINFDSTMDIVMDEISNHIPPNLKTPATPEELNQAKSILSTILRSKLIDKDKLDYLVKNIDNIILEISEIEPLLAFDLTDQYNISERLNEFEELMIESGNKINELKLGNPEDLAKLDISKLSTPLLSKTLYEQIRKHILNISRRISTNDYIATKKVLFDDDSIQRLEKLQEYFKEYFKFYENGVQESTSNQPLNNFK